MEIRIIKGYNADDLTKASEETTVPPGVEREMRFEEDIEEILKDFVEKDFPNNPQQNEILEACTLMLHIGIIMAERKYASPAERILGKQNNVVTYAEERIISGIKVLAKEIVAFGQPMTLACDANCKKAWGISGRPKEQLSDDEDDVVWHSDKELKSAPRYPGTTEGGHGKPTCKDERLNKWCYRECERSTSFQDIRDFKLTDWSKRVYNKKASDPEYKKSEDTCG